MEGQIIGKTTSASFGYRVDKPVALAIINAVPEVDLNQLNVEIDIARTLVSGTIKTAAAFDPDGKRMRPDS